jgi:hypothetical protein
MRRSILIIIVARAPKPVTDFGVLSHPFGRSEVGVRNFHFSVYWHTTRELGRVKGKGWVRGRVRGREGEEEEEEEREEEEEMEGKRIGGGRMSRKE